ncbi:MAG: prepilin-type N-terminal cleavage/methylation domain-containing protein [Candidatus Omnitrophica bacterium]|nr:prepilin-type N-terminal cleavage/methylation domain-containing protein [Candidatus Omnitrophota bacterium]
MSADVRHQTSDVRPETGDRRLETKGHSLRSPVSCLRSYQGFTLVELLIAATMLAILFVGLGAHLRGGLAVWHHATTTVEALQRQRVAFDRLDRDLANAIVYDDQDASYGTNPGQLPSLQFEGTPMRWFTVSRSTSTQPARVHVVSYACEAIDGVRGLWRTDQLIGQARARREVAPELVLPDCESLIAEFAYRPMGQPADQPGTLEWRREWSEPTKELPHLIRMTVQLTTGLPHRHLAVVPSGALRSTQPSPP